MEVTDLAGPSGDTKVLLIRHPETVANVEGKYLGWKDAPLSEKGQAQRAELVGSLVHLPITKVISSPLGRCRDLAQMIADTVTEEGGIPRQLMIDERARELGFGSMEGMTNKMVKEAGITPFWEQKEPIAASEDGELFADFGARLGSLLGDLKDETGIIALVTHGGVIRFLLAQMIGIPMSSFFQLRIENVATSVCSVFEHVFILERFGLAPREVRELTFS